MPRYLRYALIGFAGILLLGFAMLIYGSHYIMDESYQPNTAFWQTLLLGLLGFGLSAWLVFKQIRILRRKRKQA